MGRGTVNRQVQVGVESTPGTPVAANRLLPTMSLTMSPEIVNRTYRTQGFRGPTVNKITQFDGGGTLSGPLNYLDLIYPLNTIITGVIATPGGGTLSRTHTFAPVATGTDAYKTLTVQEGDATAAVQMAYGAMTDFSVRVSEESSEVTGTLVGYAPTNVTLTGSPTSIATLPSGPREVDVYIDPTFGALGTTKVGSALSFDFTIGRLREKMHVLNTTYQSFQSLTDTAVELGAKFTTEHNAQSRTLFAGVTGSSNPIQYVRFKSTGAIIEAALSYYIQLDVAARIVDMNQQSNTAVWGYEYVLIPEYDSAFGNKLFNLVIQNNITTL
jgi:hypothetical protein